MAIRTWLDRDIILDMNFFLYVSVPNWKRNEVHSGWDRYCADQIEIVNECEMRGWQFEPPDPIVMVIEWII